jgi:hypothetical protein
VHEYFKKSPRVLEEEFVLSPAFKKRIFINSFESY